MRTLPVAALVLQAVVVAALGVALFAAPAETARAWPWALTPLAARFVGSALLGIAVGVLLVARHLTPAGAGTALAMAAGTLLVPIVALLGPDPELSASRLLPLTAALAVGLAAAAGVALAVRVKPVAAGPRPRRELPRPLGWFFAIHLALVAVVGAAMFFEPAAVRHLWPWQLSIINVRLVGSIFLGSALVSALALRHRDRQAVRATLAAYAVFTALALVAVAVHFGLFDPARLVTWVFLALYALTAAVSAAGAVLLGVPEGRSPDPDTAELTATVR